MDIFHYHPQTGVLLGQGEADPSPLEPGVWLIPAHATTTAPPQPGVDEQAAWDGKGWVVQPIPAPPDPAPPPQPLPLTERLAAAGISLEELKDALAELQD